MREILLSHRLGWNFSEPRKLHICRNKCKFIAFDRYDAPLTQIAHNGQKITVVQKVGLQTSVPILKRFEPALTDNRIESMSSDVTSKLNLIVAIGASAGGFQEIVTIVEGLPQWFAGTLIVATHREPKHENTLANILARRARVRVEEPEDEESLECTTIYVGHSDETVEVDGGEFDVEVDTSRYARMHRIDDLFESVAKSAGKRAVGVILSGMLNDGTAGMRAIKDAGGRCIIQAPSDASCPSMPLNALEEVDPVFVGTAAEISSYLMEMALGQSCG